MVFKEASRIKGEWENKEERCVSCASHVTRQKQSLVAVSGKTAVVFNTKRKIEPHLAVRYGTRDAKILLSNCWGPPWNKNSSCSQRQTSDLI